MKTREILSRSAARTPASGPVLHARRKSLLTVDQLQQVFLRETGLDSVYVCAYASFVPDEVPEWTWNIEKGRGNLQKHGVAFTDAVTALEDPLALTIPDRTRDEERFVTMGLAADGAVLVVIWSPGGTGGRILSARKATGRERRSYEEEP